MKRMRQATRQNNAFISCRAEENGSEMKGDFMLQVLFCPVLPCQLCSYREDSTNNLPSTGTLRNILLSAFVINITISYILMYSVEQVSLSPFYCQFITPALTVSRCSRLRGSRGFLATKYTLILVTIWKDNRIDLQWFERWERVPMRGGTKLTQPGT